MTSKLYSLAATVRIRGTTVDLQVTAQLDLSGSGKQQTWWFATRVDRERAGDSARLPFVSFDRPPLEAATRLMKERVAAHLGVGKNDVIYANEPSWRADD